MSPFSANDVFRNIDGITGKGVILSAAVVSLYASWSSGWDVVVLAIALPTTVIAGVLILIDIHRVVNHIEEVVGKLIFVASASIAVIALMENNWNVWVLVISVPTMVLSGILIFLDFEEVRFYLYEKTGFEIIRPGRDEVLELTGGYDQLIELVSQESGELAMNLRRVQTNIQSDNPYETLSSVIEDGMSSDPIQQTVDYLNHLLRIRDYVEDPDRSELKIITRADDKLLAESKEEGTLPVEGLMFKVHATIAITERGETRYFDKVVAMAELTGTSGEVYELSTYDWDSGGDAGVSELQSTFMDRDPHLEVNKEGLESVEWDKLEDSYDFLRSVSNPEVTNGT